MRSRGLHKYVINDNRRSLTTKAKNVGQKSQVQKKEDSCPTKVCNKPEKKSFWKRLFEPKPKAKSQLPICKKKDCQAEDPDLSVFGGEPFSTCGSAYIIQKEILPVTKVETTREELLVKKLETPLEYKDTVNEDPMPEYHNVGQRLIDLNDRKLHPLYKSFAKVKKRHFDEEKKVMYKSIQWPVDMHEIPARLNLNAALLDKKNMHIEFKRIEPPRQLIGRIVEIDRNKKKTLERRDLVPVDFAKIEKRRKDAETTSKSAVFDTLYQRETKF